MDLARLIEGRRFLGREFLVSLWFGSELCEGRLEVPGKGVIELSLESQITLVQEKEESRLKGAIPSGSPEAREALRQGKLPISARIRLTQGEMVYAFVFTADTLSISAVKIPQVVKEEADEQFYERMYLIEELESLLGALYAEFLALRFSPAWEATVLPAIRAWVNDEPTIDDDAYRAMLRKASPLGKAKKPGRPAEPQQRSAAPKPKAPSGRKSAPEETAPPPA